MTLLLQTVDLCCERDGRRLVDQLNLTVEGGQIHQIEGPNGSGKTSLLRILSGLSSRYSGNLHWRGEAMSRVRAEYLAELTYLGHSSGVKAVLTPRENLMWHAALRGLVDDTAQALVMTALDKVGLYGYEDAACFTLSAGQQRRVALARLFLGQSALWILDEPFTAIDKHGVGELEYWVADYAKSGGAVVLTTHHELNIDHAIQRVLLGGT